MVKNRAAREVVANVLQVAPTPGRCVGGERLMQAVACCSQ